MIVMLCVYFTLILIAFILDYVMSICRLSLYTLIFLKRIRTIKVPLLRTNILILMSFIVSTSFVVLPISTVDAQDLQIYQPANGNWNYLSVHGTEIAPIGKWFLTIHTHYGRNPLMRISENGSVEEVVVSYLTTLEANVAIGLHERLEAGFSLPYGFSSGNNPKFGVDDGSGIGDFRLYTKILLIKPKKARDGFGVAFNLNNQLPTGEAGRNTSQRRFSSNNHLVFEYLQAKWRASINAGYRFVPSNEEASELVSSSGLTWGVGVGYQFTKGLEAISEVFQYRMDFNRTPMEALVALRMKDEKSPLSVTLGGGTGIGGDYASVEFRVLGSVTWQPSSSTPTAAINDQDFDFIPDHRDQCPTEPEDRDQYLDIDGCPDPDNDNDGILDLKDRCINDPEDIDQFEDEDGCPELDNDRDGIRDDKDQCPLKPETINQYNDADGCPDQMLGDGQLIVVSEKIFFKNNESVILRKSYPVLEQVALLMKRYPEIRLMRIEGHTDNKGRSKKNQALSEARAESVKLHLISLGVEMSRLQSIGYGDTQPIEINTTVQGRSLNRRVDFRILEGPNDIFSVDEDKDRTRSRSTPSSAKASTTPSNMKFPAKGDANDGPPYALQVNATSELSEAETLRDSLSQKGFTAYVLSVKKLEKTIHRVRIGPYWGKVRIQQVKGMYETQYPGARNLFIIKISKTEARKH